MKSLRTYQGNHSPLLVGFWVYLMTDCMLFAGLFAVYAVLHANTNGGVSLRDIANLPFVLIETILLLTSSFTCGLATIAVAQRAKRRALFLLSGTFFLGLSFLCMEFSEFAHLLHDGNSFQTSAFLSSFFTLVGTHGLHIAIGLLWLLILLISLLMRGFHEHVVKRLILFSLFWHFLDIVWIFIFTLVYLFGMS